MRRFFFKKNKTLIFLLSILTAISSIIYSFYYIDKDLFLFNELLKINPISVTFSIIILIAIILTLFSSKSYLESEGVNFGEYYLMILFATLGMLLMVFANDLIIIFAGLELMSICFYVLAGFMRKKKKSNESALKYFLLGAFMTGFLLYGMSIIFGTTGTTKLSAIPGIAGIFKNPVFLIGIILFIIGFLFKIGIFPFQMWIPDVYEGAPTIVSGMMSTAGKIAAVGTIAPIIITFNLVDFKLLFAILAVLTMLFGNVIALAQTNVKRLLAYSSIASAGYILVGISSLDEMAIKGIAFYLIAYVFMQLGSFILVAVLETNETDKTGDNNLNLDYFKGLAKRNPMLGIFFTIFLFSLAGIPPFAGFWGKYYIFYAAIKSNLIWLSIIAILLSLVSLFYYLKIIVYMWFNDSINIEKEGNKINTLPSKISLVLCIAGILVLGIYPQLFFSIFNLVIK